MSSKVSLHSCAQTNDTALFSELLFRRERDVDLNYMDETGRTALKTACERGNLEIVTLLVDAQCDVNQADNTGESPLHAACNANHIEIAQLLLVAGANVNSVSKDGISPVYTATINKSTELLRLLVSAGADVTVGDKNGATPLHMVSEHTDGLEAAEILVAAHADVNALNKYGWTPLHDAAQENNLKALLFLMDHGADVNISDMDGWTPLYIAAQNGHVQVVKALLRSGAALVDVIDKEGNTPLIVASKYGQTAVAELLLLGGADYFIRNLHGRRARDVAKVKALRKLFKAFDLGLAAARLYTKHHSLQSPQPAVPSTVVTESSESTSTVDVTGGSSVTPAPPLSPLLSMGGLASFCSTNTSPVKPIKRIKRGVLTQQSFASFRAALRAASAVSGGADESFMSKLSADDTVLSGDDLGLGADAVDDEEDLDVFDEEGSDGLVQVALSSARRISQLERSASTTVSLVRTVSDLQQKLAAMQEELQKTDRNVVVDKEHASSGASVASAGGHGLAPVSAAKAHGVITEVQLLVVAFSVMAIWYVALHVLLYSRR